MLTTALLALALTTALAGAPAHAATDATPEVTWGVRTATGEHGDGRENYAYEAAPGDTIADAIIIANHDTAPLELDIYGADGFTSSSGQLDVAPRAVTPREIGAWLVPATDRVTVAPGEAVEVPFTITVAANATPGDHAGGILTALTRPPLEDGVTVDRRLGIRIHLRVTGAIAPALAVDDLRVDYAGTPAPFGAGQATVTYTVRNSGNVRLSASQGVTLAGPFGLFAIGAPGLTPVPELLPGETWPVEVEVGGVVPAFVLNAVAALDAVPTADAPVPQRVEARASTAAVPWSFLAVLLVLAGAVALWVATRRRRRAARQAREDARVRDAVAQALRDRGPESAMVRDHTPGDSVGSGNE
ncbi:DUF916 domain-containing protein [Microbacterium rhizophilus]|uniref:DUF916 domain-containing protein n=1 Tax=Microbacterium rhizophilus TaxID=3138934 RepID=UPI0031EE4F5B